MRCCMKKNGNSIPFIDNYQLSKLKHDTADTKILQTELESLSERVKRRISAKSRSNMLQINSLRNDTVSFKKLDDVMNGARVFLGSFIIKHFPVASTRENIKWESGRSSLQSSPQGNQVIAAALRDGISCGMEITETFPHGGVFQLENPFQIRCDTRGLLILLRQRSSSAGACEIKRWALWTLSISA